MAGIRLQRILEGLNIVRWRSEARDERRNTKDRPREGGYTKM